VTVAVLPFQEGSGFRVDEGSLEFRFMRGSGAGGQHRNKTESCVAVKHLPTGIEVRCCSERSQHQNKRTALDILEARLAQMDEDSGRAKADADRRAQTGSGMRGDKVRTVRVQDGVVKCERTGRKKALSTYLAGELGF
jgi:peptide chain release factor 1